MWGGYGGVRAGFARGASAGGGGVYDLHGRLSALSVRQIVVAGLQTQFSIDTACRVAVTLGYSVVLASDSHTTFDTPILTAAQIIAHYNRTLRGAATIQPAHEIDLVTGA